MIELAPNHKHGLSISRPVMPATGIMGYGDRYHRLIPLEVLGALVTNPITAGPRRGASPPRVLPVPGGLLLHTGLENPGVNALIRRHRKHWQHSPVPVIAHVAGMDVHEVVSCVERLSRLEFLGGIELGLPDSVAAEEALQIAAAARDASTLPLIVKLPLWAACVPSGRAVGAETRDEAPDQSLAERIAERDLADALTIAAPPRGSLVHAGRTVTGRLYGPATFPQTLWAFRQVVSRVGNALPLLACGGIHSLHDASALLNAGAVAVQVDSYIWKDPAGFVRLADALASEHQKTGFSEKPGF